MMNHAIPKVGDSLTVDLPGERIRVTVGEIVDEDRFRSKIAVATTNNKAHSYKIGDEVLFERREGQIGDTWEAIDETKLLLDRLRRQADAEDARVAAKARHAR